MKLQPVVRTVLTFIAAALAVIVASVHDETVRLIGAALVVGLAAIGIVPPQLPTRTVVEKVKDERGYGGVNLIGVVLLFDPDRGAVQRDPRAVAAAADPDRRAADPVTSCTLHRIHRPVRR
jgi:hypothetical protein